MLPLSRVNFPSLLNLKPVLFLSDITFLPLHLIFNTLFPWIQMCHLQLDFSVIQLSFLFDQDPITQAHLFPLSSTVKDVSKAVFICSISLLIKLQSCGQHHQFLTCITHSLIQTLIVHHVAFYHESLQVHNLKCTSSFSHFIKFMACPHSHHCVLSWSNTPFHFAFLTASIVTQWLMH